MLYFSYDNLTGFPEAGKPVFAPIALFYYVSCCHCERSEATLGRVATTHKGSRNDIPSLLFRAGNAVFADFFFHIGSFRGGGVLQSRELSF